MTDANNEHKRKKTCTEKYRSLSGVADGARTHDNRNHNPGLYQLSYSHHKNGLQLKILARPTGIEPVTPDLEGRCSIRLSYGRSCRFVLVDWSGRWDSNSRPSAPKADALTGLRYAPTEDPNYTDPFQVGQHLLCFIFLFFIYLIIFNHYLFLCFVIGATLLCQAV